MQIFPQSVHVEEEEQRGEGRKVWGRQGMQDVCRHAPLDALFPFLPPECSMLCNFSYNYSMRAHGWEQCCLERNLPHFEHVFLS